MKKSLLLIAALCALQMANAQFVPGTSPAIHYSAGNVGIGTSNPQHGYLHIDGDGPSSGINLWNNSGSLTSRIWIDSPNKLLHISRGSDPVKGMTLNNNGQVGIRTTNPQSQLDIQASSSNQDVFKLSHPTAPLAAGYIIGFGTSGNGQDDSSVDFKVQFSSTTYNVMGIDRTTRDFYYNGDGNVGIGTTSPNAILHVHDNSNNSGVNLFDDNQGAKISNHNSTVGTYSALKLETRSDKDGAYIRGINQGNNNVNFTIGKYQSGSGGISIDWLNIKNNGNIGIGTSDPQSKLAVNGQIRATEVKVLADITVPDYVFEEDYELRTLEETQEYIAANKHLPEIPSAAEIGENGIDLGDMNMRLLKKIEELTLHLIEQNEKLEAQNKEIMVLKEQVAEIERD